MKLSPSQALALLAQNKLAGDTEVTLRSIAREVARDIIELDDILKMHGLNHAEFEDISSSPVFQTMLLSEMQAWEGASNAPERIKLKMQGMIEAAAPMFFEALMGTAHISDKTKLLQLLMKGADVGNAPANGNGPGSVAEGTRVQINITMEGNTASFTKEITPRGIDNTVNRQAVTLEDLNEGRQYAQEDEDENENEEASA